MGRQKNNDERRIHRVMLYLSDHEKSLLDFVYNELGNSKNDFIIRAFVEKLQRLEKIPESLAVSKQNKITESQEEVLKGFICSRGHIFWVDWSWPSPPENCPNCGSRHLELTWSGRIKRGI